MNNLKKVYVALGGNLGNPVLTFKKVIEKLMGMDEIVDLKVSRFYRTSPVSDLPQDPYVNAVCSFETTFSAHELLKNLQEIEKTFGKVEKPKNHPRFIDLDILFFREESYQDRHLEIPHPRWHERLFVIIPLLDLTEEIHVFKEKQLVKININSLLEGFLNINQEQVHVLLKEL